MGRIGMLAQRRLRTVLAMVGMVVLLAASCTSSGPEPEVLRSTTEQSGTDTADTADDTENAASDDAESDGSESDGSDIGETDGSADEGEDLPGATPFAPGVVNLETPPIPADAMTSVVDLGIVGDGVTDNTEALQAVLDDGRRTSEGEAQYVLFDSPIGLYFPPGTYLISEPIDWHGCCVTLQGAGPDATVIQLVDNAGAFQAPDAPAAMLRTEEGNESFRQHVRDLAIHTGSGNPGAIGLDFIANNTASIDNVRIESGDGSGIVGLDMSRKWPGPLLVQNLEVDGFDFGIRTRHPEYGPTFENLTLTNQRLAGIQNEGNTIAVRGLLSENEVPAVVTSGSAIVIDSELRGSGDAAIVNESGEVFIRNVDAPGYVTVLDEQSDDGESESNDSDDGETEALGDTVDEYLVGSAVDLHGDESSSLDIEIRETPRPVIDPVSEWASYTPAGELDAGALQRVLNSGASTVYIGFGRFKPEQEISVNVPASVRRIVGFSAAIDFAMLRLVVEESSPHPLVVDQFNDGITIDHQSDRTVAFTHGRLDYRPGPNPGPLFLEDVLMSGLVVSPDQNVWARQLNVEGYTEGIPRITNNGGTLWVLGLKTERPGTVALTLDGGSTEVLGTLVYPASQFSDRDLQDPAFVSIDSDVALIYSVSAYGENTNYPVQVRDTQNGETRDLPTAPNGDRHVSLYVSDGTADR